jgi:hypothetical protein
MECRDTQISCMAARVWQSHPRHADLRKGSRKSVEAPRGTWQGKHQVLLSYEATG